MFFHQRFVSGLAIYSYLIGDEKSRECVVIDPTRDVEDFLHLARTEGLRITHILETHVHADFVSGSVELKERSGGGAEIHCSGLGGPLWTPPYADHVVRDGDEIRLGSLRLEAVHTPGHTPEHVAWALYDLARSTDSPWLMFTGDFLFVGDVGRPDLLGAEAREVLARQLYHSVFDVLPGFPDYAEIFPGHGAGSPCGKALGARGSSTVGYERHFNAALQRREEAAWIARLLDGMPPAPPYFGRMKQLNAAGPRLLGAESPGGRRLNARQVSAQLPDEPLVLDIRSKEAFAGGHIAGSINIPLAPGLSTWAGWMLPADRPLLLVAENPADVPAAVTQLIRIGLDDVRGYLDGGINSWQLEGYPLNSLATLSVHDLARRIAGGTKLLVLDVRTDGEYQAGHIEDALHIHGGKLPERLAEIDPDSQVAVVCGSGYRSAVAASVLKREGFEEVFNVLGGMQAWKQAGFPLGNCGMTVTGCCRS
jgi:hydroxyacylglutathione hydrolase